MRQTISRDAHPRQAAFDSTSKLFSIANGFRSTQQWRSRVHGFILSRGSFTAVDFPGAISTWVTGINPAGEIVGLFTEAAGKTHGYLRKRDFISFDPPESTFTFPAGINPRGDIVGFCSDPTGKTMGSC
jgi:hypothetical protein